MTLDDVAFLLIEPPDFNYPWLKAGRIGIDAGARSASPEFKHPAGRADGHLDDLDVPRRTSQVCSSPLEMLHWHGLDRKKTELDDLQIHFQEQVLKHLMSTDDLLAEALRLTRIDRARVAEELLSSLEESNEDVATAWATELERRSRDVAEGRVQTTSWDTARTEILKDLEQRRASRTTS